MRRLTWTIRSAIVAGALGAALLATGLTAQERTALAPPAPAGMAVATFAAGCFWCTESDFDKVPGVVSTTSGYTAGSVEGPTYRQVSAGGTGHTEALRVVYDPSKVTYQALLDTFWRNVDPLEATGQFCDKGDQYRPGIFTHDADQARLAEASKAALTASARFKEPIVVKIEPEKPFYVAEEYHQDYYLKNPTKYKFYRWNCGRDQRLEELWGKKPAT